MHVTLQHNLQFQNCFLRWIPRNILHRKSSEMMKHKREAYSAHFEWTPERRSDAHNSHNIDSTWRGRLYSCTRGEPTMASPQSLSFRGKRSKLSEEDRTALALRHALALPPGNKRLPKGVLPKLAEEFGVSERYPRRL